MIMKPESLQDVYDGVFAGISQVREAFTPQLKAQEVGTVTSVATGIAKVSGLPGVGFDEVVTLRGVASFPGATAGTPFNRDGAGIGVVLLGDDSHLHASVEVQCTGRVKA